MKTKSSNMNGRRFSTLLRTAQVFALAVLSLLAPASASATGTVVISQVYGGGGGSGYYKYDYIELFNRSDVSLILTGWSLQYASASNNFTGGNLLYAIPLGTVIPPGGYLLVQCGTVGTSGISLPVTPDLVTGNLSMSQASGKVALANIATALGTVSSLPDARIVDFVGFGAASLGEGGTTVNGGVALNNQQGGVRKGAGWQDTDNNNVDFDVVTQPAPRNSQSGQIHFFKTKFLPPTNGMHVWPRQGRALYANGIIISNVAHRIFTGGILPPPPGVSANDTFSSTLEFEISLNSGTTWQPVIVTNVATTVLVGSNTTIGGYAVYTNAMTNLTCWGGNLPAGVQIRESPTLNSPGQTHIKPINGGYLVSSFFDIFTEVSTDYGSTWLPATNGPAHVELKVDPALVAAAPAPRTVFPMPNGQYISPTAWWQLYANGIVIKDARHKLFTQWMEPPLFGQTNTHTFDSQLDFQLSTDGGNSFTAARAPATMSVKISNVRGFQTQSTYETEVTQLDISGGDLPAGVLIRVSTNNATTGGTCMVAGGGGGGAGGGAAISSFFDIFTEISTDSGSSWKPATNGPARMELQRISPAYTFTDNLFPPLAGEYISPQQWWAYYANGIVISNTVHRSFSAAISLPLPGITISHTFNSQVEFDVSYDGGLTYSHAVSPATVSVQITGRLGDDGTTVYYDTEMLQYDISGGGLPANVQIRESPTRASKGRTTSSAVSVGGAGSYQIDSFFDLYTEVSTDGGQTWQPTIAGPATDTLRPHSLTSQLTITCPSNITVRATSSAGAVVTYIVKTSGGTPPVTVVCVPPSGSTFPVGANTVNCTATDSLGQRATCSFTVTVLRQLKKHFFQQNLLPPTSGMYVPPAPGVITFPSGIILSNIAQRVFSAGAVPPPSVGASVTHSFGSQVEMDVSFDSGATWQSCVATNAPDQVHFTNNGPDGGDTLYGAEWLQLNLSGGTLPAGVQIRESPTLASSGETRIQPIPGGYMIDSFFDIYLEVSTDYGGTWTPSVAPLRLELKPDPQLIAAAPAPRDVFPMPNGQYITPTAWWQLYANGIVIKDVRHKLFTGWIEPPLFGASHTHTFDSQLDFQLSTDGGLNFMAARAPVTMTVQISDEREFQGRSTYETTVTQLDVAGGDLPAGVMIRESPTKASQGGTSSLAGGGGGGAGGGAAISSFFDIFTEVSTDGGGTWNQATNGPARMELERIAPVHTYTNNLIPTLTGEYISPQQWWAYYANGIVITNASLHAFTSAITPPLPGFTTSHTFGSELEFDVSYDGGLTYSHTTAPVTAGFQITCRLGDDGVTEYYDTEMTAMSIAGGGLPSNIQIRESPTRASLGRTTMSANGTDNDCDSFFDIYTEVSTDGGISWYPTVAGPATMMLRPRAPQTALSITCSSNITVRATSPAGAVVNYTVLVSGGCSPYTTNCVPPSGSTFPIGVTVVNCSVTDVCGGQANCSFTVTVLRQLQKRFFQQNLLPPTSGMYVPPAPGVIKFPSGIILSNIAHRVFSAGVVPPPSVGGNVTHSFGSQVEMDLSFDGGLSWQSCVAANAPTQIYMINNGLDSGDTLYGGQMLQLNASGGTLPAGVMIRESPTLASSGETRIQPIPGGYMIDSFFDIYLEVSTDYGGTWTPSVAPLRLELKPDPQLIAAAPAPRKVLPMPNGQYIAPSAWWQLYANGIVIKDVRHKLFTDWVEPPLFGASYTHTFDSQLDFQLSTDGGLHFTAARAPVTTTVSINNVRGFQGRSTYETEVTQLAIAGGDLPAGVQIRESPTKASKGGDSQLAGGGGGGAGGGAAISSFFDIFTEVSTDGGGTWAAATNGPAHVELRRIAPANLFTNNLLPPLAGEYISPQQWYAYYANGIVLTNVVHRSFTAAIPPPLPGITTSHTFGSQVEFDVSYDGGLTFTHTTAPATNNIQITARLGDDGVTEYYDTEMTRFDIAGGGLPAGMQIRESPTKASKGRTTASAVSGGAGGYQIDSFFDIYTEVSTDGGLSWLPTVAGPATVTLQPQSVIIPVTPVIITGILPANGGGYTIAYTKGSGSQFILLTSPTVTAPMSTWTPVVTNYTGAGLFTVSPTSATFYRVKSK